MPRLIDYDYKPGEEFTLRFHLAEARQKLVGEETAEHLRNALQFLNSLSGSSRLNQEDRADLDGALRRITLALKGLERRGSPPRGFAPLF